MATTLEKISTIIDFKNYLACKNDRIPSMLLSYILNAFTDEDDAKEIYEFLRTIPFEELYNNIFNLNTSTLNILKDHNVKELMYDMNACEMIRSSYKSIRCKELFNIWLEKITYIITTLNNLENKEVLAKSTSYGWKRNLLYYADKLFHEDAAYYLNNNNLLDLFDIKILSERDSIMKSIFDKCLTKSKYAYEFYIACTKSNNPLLNSYPNLYLICYNKIINQEDRNKYFITEFKSNRLNYLIKYIYDLKIEDYFLIDDMLDALYLKNPKCKKVEDRLKVFFKKLLFKCDVKKTHLNTKILNHLKSNNIILKVCQELVLENSKKLLSLDFRSSEFNNTSFFIKEYFKIVFPLNITSQWYVDTFKEEIYAFGYTDLATIKYENLNQKFKTFFDSTLFSNISCPTNNHSRSTNVEEQYNSSNLMRNQFLDVLKYLIYNNIYGDVTIEVTENLFKMFLIKSNVLGMCRRMLFLEYNFTSTLAMLDFLFNDNFKEYMNLVYQNKYSHIMSLNEFNKYFIEDSFNFSENEAYPYAITHEMFLKEIKSKPRYQVSTNGHEFGLLYIQFIPAMALAFAKLKKDYNLDYFDRYCKYNNYSIKHSKYTKLDGSIVYPEVIENLQRITPKESLYSYYIIILHILRQDMNWKDNLSNDIFFENKMKENTITSLLSTLYSGIEDLETFQKEFSISKCILDFIRKVHIEYYTVGSGFDMFIDSASENLSILSRENTNGYLNTCQLAETLLIDRIKEEIKLTDAEYYNSNNLDQYSYSLILEKIKEIEDFLNLRALA